MSEVELYRGRAASLVLAGRLKVAVWVITVAVLFLVGLMRPLGAGMLGIST